MRSDEVPATHRTIVEGRRAANLSVAARASDVLPTPSAPTRTAPDTCGLSRALVTCWTVVSANAATQGIAGLYGAELIPARR